MSCQTCNRPNDGTALGTHRHADTQTWFCSACCPHADCVRDRAQGRKPS